MNKKKILIIIGIIILVIISIFLIHTIRNFIIVSKLQNNISQYVNSTNYHIKSLATMTRNDMKLTINTYRKDNKQASFLERNSNGEIIKMSMYGSNDKKGYNTYIDSGNSKVVNKESEGKYILLDIFNGVESDSTWHTILSSAVAFIGSENVNGKECYVVCNFPSFSNLMLEGNNKYYIEKDTGLLIKSITNEQISEREYEFDNVDDSIFEEPDISQYTIKEN